MMLGFNERERHADTSKSFDQSLSANKRTDRNSPDGANMAIVK